MKNMMMVMLALAGLVVAARADEAKTAVDETTPAPAVAKDVEETKVMTGLIEEKIAGGGNLIRIFIDQETGKRMVLPSHERQLPSNFTWEKYPGPVELKALLWHRVKDGKTQVVVKRILEIKPTAPATEIPAPAAAEGTP